MTFDEILLVGMPILLGVLSYFLVTIGGGKVIEEFTNERLMKWVWVFVMTMFAGVMAIGMWGFGEGVSRMAEYNQPGEPIREDDPTEGLPKSASPSGS